MMKVSPMLQALLVACLLAAASAGNGFSTTSTSDVAPSQTLSNAVLASSAFKGAAFTATQTCNATCLTSLKAMRLAAYNGTCDQCTSNTGNSSIASWSANSTNCTACANTWNTYVSACSGGSNKPCFNFQTVASGSTPNSIASLMTQQTAGGLLGDVYDFLSSYTSAISTCSDMVDYVINYAFTTANDPLYGVGGVPDCPVVGGSSPVCSAACNSDWQALQTLCTSGSTVQYDYNGLPGGTAAPQNTFLPINTVMNYIVNGTAFGPWNNNTASGADAAMLLTDPSCVASAWLNSVNPAGSSDAVAMDSSSPIPTVTATSSLNISAAVAALPKPTSATMTCLQAANLFNISTTTGNCNVCNSDTGAATGCSANCPLCAADFNNVQSACGPSGDNTLQPTFALVSSWAQNLISVGSGNFTFGDCYIQLVSTMLQPAAAQCSDYMTYMVYYSQSAFMVAPNNASHNGPNCPITASDTEYPSTGACPAGCQTDLANLAGCYSTSQVVIPGVINALFPVAWAAFVNGSLSTSSGVQNTMTSLTGSPYLLSSCNSTLATYAPGVLANGTVSSLLPTGPPNCTTARAALIASTVNGACDQCSSATGNAANCFTSVAGDPDCTACGVQFDAYTAQCNETYNDIGNTMVANLMTTNAAGNRSDCFDFFNQLAQSNIGQPGFDTDVCSDAWDSIVQYSETLWNDPLNAGPAGPNCPTAAGTTCSLACNNDLMQLNSSCTSTSVVQWAGFGIPGGVAPAGTNVSLATAWLLFVNGTATAPIGNIGTNSSTAFALGNCTLPSWAPLIGAGSAAGMVPVTVTGSFSLNLGSMTPSQFYASNAGKLENAIAASLGISGSAVAINWASLGVTVAGRRLLATTIQYTATVTASQQTAVAASVAAFNPATLPSGSLPAGISAPSASAASSFTPAVAVAMAAVAAVATLI